MSEQSTSGDPIAAFGPNEWLVDELYQRYLTDKTRSTRPGGSSSRTTGRARRTCRQRVGTGAPGGDAAERRRRRPTAPRPTGAPAAPVKAEPAPAPHGEGAPRAAGAGRGEAGARRPPRRPRPTPRGEARGQGRAQGGAQAEPTAEPKPRDVPAVKQTGPVNEDSRHPAARCPAARRRQHGDLADGAHRHERARRPGQAAHRQPRRHQQPPRPLARRQGELHAPHRLRHGQGPRDHAGDEQRLHREGRPPGPAPAGPRQLRPRHRPAEGRRHPHPRRALDQVGRGDGLRPLLDRLRGHGQEGPRTTS